MGAASVRVLVRFGQMAGHLPFTSRTIRVLMEIPLVGEKPQGEWSVGVGKATGAAMRSVLIRIEAPKSNYPSGHRFDLSRPPTLQEWPAFEKLIPSGRLLYQLEVIQYKTPVVVRLFCSINPNQDKWLLPFSRNPV